MRRAGSKRLRAGELLHGARLEILAQSVGTVQRMGEAILLFDVAWLGE